MAVAATAVAGGVGRRAQGRATPSRQVTPLRSPVTHLIAALASTTFTLASSSISASPTAAPPSSALTNPATATAAAMPAGDTDKPGSNFFDRIARQPRPPARTAHRPAAAPSTPQALPPEPHMP